MSYVYLLISYILCLISYVLYLMSYVLYVLCISSYDVSLISYDLCLMSCILCVLSCNYISCVSCTRTCSSVVHVVLTYDSFALGGWTSTPKGGFQEISYRPDISKWPTSETTRDFCLRWIVKTVKRLACANHTWKVEPRCDLITL